MPPRKPPPPQMIAPPVSPARLNDLAQDLDLARQDAHARANTAREQLSKAAADLLRAPVEGAGKSRKK